MQSPTHISTGFAFGVISMMVLPQTPIKVDISSRNSIFIWLISCSVGAVLNDIDTKKSWISQTLPIANLIIDPITRHRKFTHVFFPLMLPLIWFLVRDLWWLGFAVGCFSHSVIDVFGYVFGIECGSRGEKIIFVMMQVLGFYLFVYSIFRIDLFLLLTDHFISSKLK